MKQTAPPSRFALTSYLQGILSTLVLGLAEVRELDVKLVAEVWIARHKTREHR